MAKGPLLDLSTLAPERPIVRIDGVDYEMTVAQDLGAREFAEFNRLQAKYRDLFLAARTGQEEDIDGESLAAVVDALVRIAIRGVPDETLGRLPFTSKSDVVLHFFGTAGLIGEQPMQAADQPARSTTPKRSRGSRGSTAGARGSG